MAMITTLNKIRTARPCKSGWKKLLKHLNKTTRDDVEFNLSVVVESNGLYDAIWCMRTLEDLSTIGVFAEMCANSVVHFNNYSSKKSNDAAADAASYDAAYAAAAAAADAAAATYADAYADADDAAYAAAAADAYADAFVKQNELNKQFFLSLC